MRRRSVVGGALEGSLTDPSGGLVAGARVRLREVGTHREREAATDAQGDSRVPELAPGTYEVSVVVPGFTPYRHTGVTIPLGFTVRLEIQLQSASVQTQVTVSGRLRRLTPRKHR